MARTDCEGVVARQKSHFRSEEPKDWRVRVNPGVEPPPKNNDAKAMNTLRRNVARTFLVLLASWPIRLTAWQ